MAIYEVTLMGQYQGQECINRWNYVSTGTPAAVTGSYALIDAMGFIPDPLTGVITENTVFGRVVQISSADMAFVQASVREIWSPTDFYELPYVDLIYGTTGGEGASPALAYGFFTNRVRRDVRRGQKRFAGVSETAMGDGGVLAAGIRAVATELAAVMSANLTYNDEGNTITFTPAVCGKRRYVPNPERPDRVAYEYYDNETEQLAHTATGILWSFYPEVRTQVSRQYGRGR